MLVPTTPKPHFAMNTVEDDPTYDEFIKGGMANLIYFLSPFNITSMPAMSIPSGFSDLDMPVGMQWLGTPFDEPTMLMAAYPTNSTPSGTNGDRQFSDSWRSPWI